MRAGKGTRYTKQFVYFSDKPIIEIIEQKERWRCWRRIVYALEALPVDNARARLVVLLLGDPHLLEGGEGGKDGSSDPDRVLPLWWSNDLDLDG